MMVRLHTEPFSDFEHIIFELLSRQLTNSTEHHVEAVLVACSRYTAPKTCTVYVRDETTMMRFVDINSIEMTRKFFLPFSDDGVRDPIPVNVFADHVAKMKANDSMLFGKEYEVSGCAEEKDKRKECNFSGSLEQGHLSIHMTPFRVKGRWPGLLFLTTSGRLPNTTPAISSISSWLSELFATEDRACAR